MFKVILSVAAIIFSEAMKISKSDRYSGEIKFSNMSRLKCDILGELQLLGHENVSARWGFEGTFFIECDIAMPVEDRHVVFRVRSGGISEISKDTPKALSEWFDIMAYEMANDHLSELKEASSSHVDFRDMKKEMTERDEKVRRLTDESRRKTEVNERYSSLVGRLNEQIKSAEEINRILTKSTTKKEHHNEDATVDPSLSPPAFLGEDLILNELRCSMRLAETRLQIIGTYQHESDERRRELSDADSALKGERWDHSFKPGGYSDLKIAERIRGMVSDLAIRNKTVSQQKDCLAQKDVEITNLKESPMVSNAPEVKVGKFSDFHFTIDIALGGGIISDVSIAMGLTNEESEVVKKAETLWKKVNELESLEREVRDIGLVMEGSFSEPILIRTPALRAASNARSRLRHFEITLNGIRRSLFSAVESSGAEVPKGITNGDPLDGFEQKCIRELLRVCMTNKHIGGRLTKFAELEGLIVEESDAIEYTGKQDLVISSIKRAYYRLFSRLGELGGDPKRLVSLNYKGE